MEICNHHIDKIQIIGIGPLMTVLHPNTTLQQAYNPRQLHFYLHLNAPLNAAKAK